MLISALVCCIWIVLLFGRKGFWLVCEPSKIPARLSHATSHPSVAAIVPARNEAELVGRAIGSLLQSDYPLSVFLVDDHSTDGTATAAGQAARLHVIPAGPLPPGWSGKVWAVSQGIEAAGNSPPDYYLLTDADIEHAPDNLSQLVARAEAGGFDLVSLMVKLHCQSLAEKALIPAFVFFFFMLYPPGAQTWGAAGGCILVRRHALERIGGMECIRGELIDDCALARAVKQSGGTVWLGVTRTTRSIRSYPTFAEIERMISRTAFTQLKYSPLLLLGAIAGMTATYVLPPALAIAGYPLGAAAWLLMAISYIPVVRFYKRSLFWAPLLPLIALYYTGATVHSAFQYWRGRGGMWKGRAQAT